MPKSPRYSKQKGRNFQNWCRDKLIEILNLTPEDIKTAIMGENGDDIKLFGNNRNKFPYRIECKAVERLNVYEAYEQAKSHGEGEPVLFMKKNRKEPLAVVSMEHFIRLHREKE